MRKVIVDFELDEFSDVVKYIIFRDESICHYKENDELNYIIEYLNKYKFDLKICKDITLDNVIETNKKFFNKFFNLSNIIIKKNNELFYASSFDIDINLVDGSNVGNLNIDITSHYNTVCESIDLGKNLTNNSISIYAHEIVHSQIGYMLGWPLTNYYNGEVMSILIEKIIAYEMVPNNLEYTELMRMELLKNNFALLDKDCDKNKKCKIITYIESTLIANHIFDIYKNSNRSKQIEMLNELNKVFKRDNSVENFINLYDVSYNNSKILKYSK